MLAQPLFADTSEIKDDWRIPAICQFGISK